MKEKYRSVEFTVIQDNNYSQQPDKSANVLEEQQLWCTISSYLFPRSDVTRFLCDYR